MSLLALLAASVLVDPAAVARLNAALLASDSATATLQAVCDRRGRGERIRAVASANRAEPSPPNWVRARLKPTGEEPVWYRRVELACGGKVLSRADNWYLPARLTPEMNRRLLSTPTPFGVAVRGMGFTRRTVAVARLAGPRDVLRHTAVLIGADARPFSLVRETYAAAALDPR
jgi:chorismate-pyruvate lyase